MEIINNGSGCPLVRVDYSNEKPWHQLLKYFVLAGNEEDYDETQYYPEFLIYEGEEFKGVSLHTIISFMREPKAMALFVFDRQSVVDKTLLCVDLNDENLKFFRLIHEEAAAVENNLSLVNMVFTDFYESCDQDGVFRGFSDGDPSMLSE